MQPMLDQQKLKALVYYIEVALPLPFFSLYFWAFCFVRFSWITCLESEVQSRSSWCHWEIGQWVNSLTLYVLSFFKSWHRLSITGADGLQFIASHIVQEEGGRALGASPTICQNSNRVDGVQRQQSSIQGIPLCALVVSPLMISLSWIITPRCIGLFSTPCQWTQQPRTRHLSMEESARWQIQW